VAEALARAVADSRARRAPVPTLAPMPTPLERLRAALADRYRVDEEIGAGGMATVYRAHDLRHERDVAIKVLHPDLGAALGGERFLTEIRTTARLQHPHILPLLDSGDADGLLFYVMPLVTGETLRARLEREQQLPIADAVQIAREVADALGHAHALGVIHRDIKPENILLQGGHALVADFGIALAVQTAGGQRMTQTGLSLGTPQYMSPEQAMGERAIDARSDIYALAAVTYEMIAGEAPFTGPSVQAIVARLLSESPRSLGAQRKSVPEHVDAAVLQALEKLPADRFATATEFSAALASGTGARAITRATAVAGPLGLSPRASGLLMAGLAVMAVSAVGFALSSRAAQEPPRVARFELSARDGQQLVAPGGTRFAWSPDGQEYVYTGVGPGATVLWSRKLNALDAAPIRGAENATSPTFSPDGRTIAFVTVAPFTVSVVPRGGGQARAIVKDGIAAGGGVTWSDDGFLYFDAGPGLARVAPDGSAYEMVLPLDTAEKETGVAWPRALPNGRGILVRVRREAESMSDWSVVVLDLRDRSRKELVRGIFAIYSPRTEHLVWATGDGTVMAQRFDLDRLELLGDPVQLWSGLAIGGFGAVDLVLASTGDLLYVQGSSAGANGRLTWVDRAGAGTAADTASVDGLVRSMVLSPNGASVALAMERQSDVSSFGRIWVGSMGGGPLQLVTTENAIARTPVWTPDSRSVIYVSQGASQIRRRRTGGGGDAELIATVPRGVVGLALHPSGSSLVLLAEDSGERRRELLTLQLDGDRVPTALGIEGGVNLEPPYFSPDGRWLAYVSPLSGRDEVYVSPYPDVTSGRVQVSANGGGAPRWNPRGGELFYVGDDGGIVAVRFSTSGGFRVTATERLFAPLDYRAGESRVFYEPAPDGQRFLMLNMGGRGGESRPVIVQNFTEELRARVP
jgi:eukaryotic-like serine/threonine-protein kinase